MGWAGWPSLLALLLFVGVMMGAEGGTRRRGDRGIGGLGAELFVTSSIAPNKPIHGDTVGPLAVGQELALTCSTQDSPGVLLSWWEGGSQLSAVLQEGEGITSVIVTVGALALQDSGRRFTCREKGTEVAKSIKLDVQQGENGIKEILQVLLGGLTLEDMDSINVKTSDDVSMNCVNQGYNPSAVSWWEDDVELESVAAESPYATNSVLSLKALTVDDRGRSLTCRSLNGQLSITVTIYVNVAEERNPVGRLTYKLSVFSVTALVVFLLAIVVVADLHMKIRSQAKKSAGTHASKKMAAGEQGSGSTILGAVRDKMTGNTNNFGILVNEEDFDEDSSVEVIQAADAS